MHATKRKIDLTVGGYIFHKNTLLLIHHKKLDKWLPVGGHIDADEMPDHALRREILEEVNLEVDFYEYSFDDTGKGSVVESLARPFHVNCHSVGDHDHVCFFYICKAKNPEALKRNHETNDAKWHSKKEVEDSLNIPDDVKLIALHAWKSINNRK